MLQKKKKKITIKINEITKEVTTEKKRLVCGAIPETEEKETQFNIKTRQLKTSNTPNNR